MRRMWMLLLTVLALTMILAVPAIAASHTAHDASEWTVLKSGDTTLTEGKYYLTGDITASITSTSGNIVICLNGKTWEGAGARPLAITGGSVTICDCSYVAPTVAEDGTVGQATGGKIVGYQYSGAENSGNGGAINVASGASFTLESGTVTGGRASTGGNIYSKGTVIINGGIVRDGEAGAYGSNNAYSNKGWGGNIDINDGTLRINGGIISGGKAGGNGGNVRLEGNADTVVMTDGIVAGGDSRDNGGNFMIQSAVSLEGGLIIAGTANNGGNMSINAGSKTVALSNVTIKNGVSCGGANANSQYDANGELVLNNKPGANVRLFNAAATLTINNGTVITGGQSIATDGSQNVYVGKTGSTLNLGTCTIDGYVYVVDTCTVNVTGAPEVTGGDTNLRLGKSVLTVTDMTDGEVGITTTAGVSAAFTAAVTNTAFENYFTSDNEAFAVTYNYQDDKLWLGEAYCVCGASKNGGNHVQHTDANGNLVGCDGTILGWLKWTSDTALPKGHGNFYLSADSVTFTDQFAPEKNATMRLDLNGKVVTDTSARMIATATANSSGSVDLWITDTAANGGGTLKSTSANYKGQGAIARLANSSTLHLVAGTLDASAATLNGYNGVAVCIESGCAFNMYGGTIYGGRGDRHGGAVRIDSGAFLNMYGGTIYGGEVAEQGGAVSVAGTAYISGGTIQGGKAGYGGALAISGGTSVIKNCVIKDGVALRAETQYETPEEGDPTVATVGNSTGRGGNIYVASATVEMENCVISGGKIQFASGVYEPYELVLYEYEEDGETVKSTSAQYNNWGATGIFVTSNANVTAEDCEIYGGTELQEGVDYVAYQGGTIYINGNAMLTLKGDSVVTASPVKQKGAVIHRANGRLYIQDNTLIDASYYYAYNETTGKFEPDENAPVQAKAGVAMNFDNGTGECVMTGGTVIGGEAIGTPKASDGLGGGAIVMTGSTKFTFSGGTIKNGTSAYGGNIYVNNGTLTLNGGTIQDGTATAQGGNIYVYAGTVNMTSGTIQRGEAAKNGGSVHINAYGVLNMSDGLITGGVSTGDQGGNIFCSGSMSLKGGTVSQGTSRNVGGNISINSSGKVEISGVKITKGKSNANNGNNLAYNLNIKGAVSHSIGGGTQITAPDNTKGSNLYVATNTYDNRVPEITISITDCFISGGETNVRFECSTLADATDQPSITANISGDCTLGGYPTLAGAGKDNITINWTGYALNNYQVIYNTLAKAIDAVDASSDYVTLLSNSPDAVTVSANLNLDLNGHTVALNPAEGVKIKLFDSTAANYTAGTGKATGGTIDNYEQVFLTGSMDGYGHNYRFVTIQDADGSFTSHRIYLAVKSTDLVPGAAPTVKHSIVLRCDSTLAGLLNNDGTYGLTVNDKSYDAIDLISYEVKAYNAAEAVENAVRFGVTNILGEEDNQIYGETPMSANAFMSFTDAKGNAYSITSASSTARSLKDMVGLVNTAAADADQVAAMSDALKAKLGEMYTTWNAKMTEWNWSIDNLAQFVTTAE